MSQSPESVTSEAHGSPEPASQMAPEPTLPEEPTGSSTRPKQLSRNSSSRESSVSTRQDENEDASPDGVEKDEKTGGMGEGARNATREQARQLQSGLLEIAESIELVKADHDKLEKQNLALQDYIGGLTRAMSKGQGPKGAKSSSK
ncbi:MAG: hypothetical protein GOMPHAMPRED_003334 [Gomphillus americanus]|uniref:BZIP transcription factor n=1 Tax=Gomphillus americanus TaxID=1940652 RepID=A0A8H3EHC6_9LECA|nr:MAG: hypothetical protein GOMPHAMPRED_003334 [Gomphillus americanus]